MKAAHDFACKSTAATNFQKALGHLELRMRRDKSTSRAAQKGPKGVQAVENEKAELVRLEHDLKLLEGLRHELMDNLLPICSLRIEQRIFHVSSSTETIEDDLIG